MSEGSNQTVRVIGPEAQSGTQPSTGPIGATINGRYQIRRLIGEGGMGGVYEGEHLEIGKRVAIKLVHALHAGNPQVAARIKQEARSTSAIESDHIVQVFDAGEDPRLGLYLIMEFLKGEDLSRLIARHGRVSPLSAAMIVVQAAQGLTRAHAAGIVHRDLKPANIFVIPRDDGSSLVKLVDFGIAKLVRDVHQQQSASLTRMGMAIGTPQYMSPEQAQGLPSIDHRTDIYSLGAVLYEAVVGHSPIPELPTYEQTILQIMTRPAPRISASVPDAPPALDQLCADMMAMDPNVRPQDMSTVRARLLAIFPEIQNGRLPMKSLVEDAALAATAFAPASGEVPRMLAAALAEASTAPAVPPSARAPITHVATKAVVNASTSDPAPPDEAVSIPGVSERRRAPGLIVGAVIAAAVVAVGVGALVSRRGQPPPAPGYGMVQTVEPDTKAAAIVATGTPAQNVEPLANKPPAVDAAPVARPAEPPPSSTARSKRETTKPSAPTAVERPTSSNKPAAGKPVIGAPANGDPPPAPAPGRPVGGTGVATEF